MTHLIKIKKAAEDGVRAVVERFDRADRLLLEGNAKIAGGIRGVRSDYSVCLATLVGRYPNRIPAAGALKHELLADGEAGLFSCARPRYSMCHRSGLS